MHELFIFQRGIFCISISVHSVHMYDPSIYWLLFFSDILNMYSPPLVIFNIPPWDSILMFLVRALPCLYSLLIHMEVCVCGEGIHETIIRSRKKQRGIAIYD